MRKKLIKNALVAVFTLFIVFALFNFKKALAQEITISQNETWPRDRADLVFDGPVYVEDGAMITIEKGTVIKFENSGNDDDPSGIFVNDGNLVVNGTQEDYVKFTSDQENSNFLIYIYNSEKPSFFRYAEISKAGCDRSGDIPPVLGFAKSIFSNTAYADDWDIRYHGSCAALNIEGGNAHIENSIFKDNYSAGVYISDEHYNDFENEIYKIYKGRAEIVNSNFYDENTFDSGISCLITDEETGEESYEPLCNCYPGDYGIVSQYAYSRRISFRSYFTYL
jgi:hypothetical protein